MASAWLENFSKYRFATRRCSAIFSSAEPTMEAFLRNTAINSGQRGMTSYWAASASITSVLLGCRARIRL